MLLDCLASVRLHLIDRIQGHFLDILALISTIMVEGAHASGHVRDPRLIFAHNPSQVLEAVFLAFARRIRVDVDQTQGILIIDENAGLRIGDVGLALLDQLSCNGRREFDAVKGQDLEEALFWHDTGLCLVQHIEEILDLGLQPVAKLRQEDLAADGLVL